MATQRIALLPYFSQKHQETSWCLTVGGTSQKLFFGPEGLEELRRLIVGEQSQP